MYKYKKRKTQKQKIKEGNDFLYKECISDVKEKFNKLKEVELEGYVLILFDKEAQNISYITYCNNQFTLIGATTLTARLMENDCLHLNNQDY